MAYRHCYAMVHSTARRITGDPSDAEDVAQATFEKLARRIGDVRDAYCIPGFLKTCAVFEAVGHVRRRDREERLLHENCGADADPEPHPVLLQWAVRHALQQLDPEEQAAAILKHVERRTHREVAGTLGVSHATARRRLSGAEAKLRGQLRP